MTRKTPNPVILRLLRLRGFDSCWYSDKHGYANAVAKDMGLRKMVLALQTTTPRYVSSLRARGDKIQSSLRLARVHTILGPHSASVKTFSYVHMPKGAQQWFNLIPERIEKNKSMPGR